MLSLPVQGPRQRADAGAEPAPDATGPPLVGVLALQGDVAEHIALLGSAPVRAVPVKTAEALSGVDGLVIPGGESTTIGKLLAIYDLVEPLRALIRDGLPVFGTCAGAILLAREALHHDGTPSGQPLLEVMDTVVRRNAFGRQVASFEADLQIEGVPGPPLHAVFIRAPWIEEAGPSVEILAEVGTPLGAKVVVARQGHLLASSFHPELAGDPRLHHLFVEMVCARRERRRSEES